MDFRAQMVTISRKHSGVSGKLMIAILTLLVLFGMASLKNSLNVKTAFLAGTIVEEEASVPAPELSQDTVYMQRMPCPQNNTTAIGLKFATYARENTGMVTVTIRGAHGAFGEQTYDVALFQDNAYVYIPLERSAEAGEMLEIAVTSTSPAGQGVTVWSTEMTTMEQFGAELTVNGEPQITQLFVAFQYRLGLARTAILMALIAAGCAALIFLSRKGMEYLLLFVLGLVLLFLRSTYNFTIPSVYGEDGAWTSQIIYDGALRTAFFARGRGDYPVVGNVLLLRIAMWMNELLFGLDISRYPMVVAFIQYAFYSMAALLPVVLMKDELPKWMARALWLSILLLPMGEWQSEILGKISNTGYLVYFIAFCLVYHRVFHWERLSVLKLAILDVLLFICCGTHEGCYLLVGLGFFLNVWLEMRSMERSAGVSVRVKNWLGRAHNRMWIVLGICCCALACFDLFVLTGVSGRQGMARPGKEIVEFLIREFLFSFVWPFYSRLNTGSALILLCVAAVLIIYTFVVSDSRYRVGLACCVTATLLYGAITLIARGSILTGVYIDFAISADDRYYYGCNVMANLTAVYCVACLFKAQKRRRKILGGAIAALLILPVVFSGIELIDGVDKNVYVSIVHPTPFSVCLAAAQSDETKQNYTIDIAPDSWQMTVPSKYVLASLVH